MNEEEKITKALDMIATGSDLSEEAKAQYAAEKKAMLGTPVQKAPPIAYLRVDITSFIINPDFPEKGDQAKLAPLIFEINDHKKADHLPPGMISDMRELLMMAVSHARTHTPVTPPLAIPAPNNDAGAAEEAPALTTPPEEIEQGICARCGWRELECGCAEGFLAPEAA